jgi:quinol monooxygenase YgiN
VAKSSQPSNDAGASAPITVISHVRARKGYEAIVRDMLQRLVVPSRAESGCLEYSLHESIADPTLYVIYQVWDNEAALVAHSSAPHTAGFRRAAPGVLDGPINNSRWRRMA